MNMEHAHTDTRVTSHDTDYSLNTRVREQRSEYRESAPERPEASARRARMCSFQASCVLVLQLHALHCVVRHARVSVVASEPRARAARRGSVGVVIVAQGIRSTPVGTLTNIESVIVGGVIDV